MLGTRDDFVERLSPFDRAARLKSAGDVSEADYLAFARAAGREWSNDERARLTEAFAAIAPRLAELLPELGLPMLLVKTSGEEEGGAGYTRGNAIMLFPEVAGLYEQIGRNTDYVIHPEEILASNLELLVEGVADAPSPEILARMRAELTRVVAR